MRSAKNLSSAGAVSSLTQPTSTPRYPPCVVRVLAAHGGGAIVEGGVVSVGSPGIGRATTAGSSGWISSPYCSDRSIVVETATVDVVTVVLVDAAVVVDASVGASDVPVVGTANVVDGWVGSWASLLAT